MPEDYAGLMTNTIPYSPVDAPTARVRRGAGLGIASLALSLVTAFWSVIVWAIGLAVPNGGTGYEVALVVLALCSFIGLAFFAFTVVVAVLALLRNGQVGVTSACVGLVLAVGGLIVGILVAASVL